MSIETKSTGMRCRKCNTAFFSDLPVGVPVDVWVAATKCIRCPSCKAGYRQISLGMGLSESEDMARRPESTESIRRRADAWIFSGETGLSSMTICNFMLGNPVPNPSHPYDPSDVRRCILLLDRIPEWKPRMAEMACLEGWERLAPEWDRVVALLREECPELKGMATRTYALIKQLTEYREAA